MYDVEQYPWSPPTRCQLHPYPQVMTAIMSPDIAKCPLGVQLSLSRTVGSDEHTEDPLEYGAFCLFPVTRWDQKGRHTARTSFTFHASERPLPALRKVPGSLSGLTSSWLHGSSHEGLPHTCSVLKSACGTKNKKRKCNQGEEGMENPVPPTCCLQGPLRQRS